MAEKHGDEYFADLDYMGECFLVLEKVWPTLLGGRCYLG